MVKEAESHASEDKKRKEEAEMKNKADSLCHSVEKQLSEMGDKVPEPDRNRLRKLIDDLRSAIQDGASDRIKQLHDELQQAAYAISTKAYETAGAGAGSESGTNGAGPEPEASRDEEIIDAEFRPTDEGVGATKP
jgi:molecular chaperone DnaK